MGLVVIGWMSANLGLGQGTIYYGNIGTTAMHRVGLDGSGDQVLVGDAAEFTERDRADRGSLMRSTGVSKVLTRSDTEEQGQA